MLVISGRYQVAGSRSSHAHHGQGGWSRVGGVTQGVTPQAAVLGEQPKPAADTNDVAHSTHACAAAVLDVQGSPSSKFSEIQKCT